MHNSNSFSRIGNIHITGLGKQCTINYISIYTLAYFYFWSLILIYYISTSFATLSITNLRAKWSPWTPWTLSCWYRFICEPLHAVKPFNSMYPPTKHISCQHRNIFTPYAFINHSLASLFVLALLPHSNTHVSGNKLSVNCKRVYRVVKLLVTIDQHFIV